MGVGYDEFGDAAVDAAFDTIQEISDDNIRSYLGSNGDAIVARIENCVRQAKELRNTGYFQSSHVLAVTALEILIRFMLIRPLLQGGQGAFLSDEWADFITQKIATGRSADDRKLLPQILALQAIDIHALRLPSGKALWETIVTDAYPKRNRVIHYAELATAEEAQTAIDCAEYLYTDVVLPIATKLGFTLETTNCWSSIRRQKALNVDFTVSNPFE